MKSTLLTLFFAFGAVAVVAQNPVPNPGFEIWNGTEPDGWLTNNAGLTTVPISTTNDSYAGTTAARGEAVQNGPSVVVPPSLLSTDASGNGFAVAKPHDYFNFYYKFDQQGNDIFTITVAMLDAGGNMVAGALVDITTPSTSYTPMSIALGSYSGTPVTCIISFTATDQTAASATPGTSFKVDKLSLSNNSITGISTPVLVNSPLVSQNTPNPASGNTVFQYTIKEAGPVSILISDLAGKQIFYSNQTIASGTFTHHMDVSSLENGIYFYTVTSAGQSTTQKMVVSK